MICQGTVLRWPAIKIASDGPVTDRPLTRTETAAFTRVERAEPRRWTPGGTPAQHTSRKRGVCWAGASQGAAWMRFLAA